MHLIFAGTPKPAVVALRKLPEDSYHEIVAVLTRPDARRGRGESFSPSPVKALALEYDIPVLTPTTLRGEEIQQQIHGLNADCIPMVAYGNLVPGELLDVPTRGWVNLHFSLLPTWRGTAPVQAAIAAGDEVTGANIFRTEKGLGTRPIFDTATEAIRPTDNADGLLIRLAYSGTDLLAATMGGIEAGALRPTAQPEQDVSYAAKFGPEGARIIWAQSRHLLDRRARAFTPTPGAWTTLSGSRLKVGELTPLSDEDNVAVEEVRKVVDPEAAAVAPGELVVEKHRVSVRCADGYVQLVKVQPQGEKMMDVSDWARGNQPGGKVYE